MPRRATVAALVFARVQLTREGADRSPKFQRPAHAVTTPKGHLPRARPALD